MAQAKVVTTIMHTCVRFCSILRSSVDDDHSVASHRFSIVHLNCFLWRGTNMWNRAIFLILVTAAPWVACLWHADSGPWFEATKGEIWPMPNSRVVKEDFYLLRPSNFDIRVSFILFFFFNILYPMQRIN